MDSHEIETLVKALRADHVRLVNKDRRKIMLCGDSVMGEWEVWGQTRKYERTHCIEHGEFETCLKVLIGEEA